MTRWVAIDVAVGDNPKVRRFASELFGTAQLAVPAAIGHLTMLFGAIKASAPSGDLTGVPDDLLEEWARWRGKRGRLASAFRALFAPDGDLHDWEEWNGDLIRQQEANREKARNWRLKQAANRSTNGATNGTRTSTETVRELVREPYANGTRTANLPTDLPKDLKASAAQAPPDPQVEAVLSYYGELHPKRRPGKQDRTAIARALKTYTLEQVRDAIAGNAHDPWHADRAKHELTYVLRDNGKIDTFIAMAHAPPSQTTLGRALTIGEQTFLNAKLARGTA